MSTPNTRKTSVISISMMALVGMVAFSGCSQKPSSEEIAAQVKIAMEKAEKEKQEAAAREAKPAPAAPVAAAPAPAPVAPPPKHVAKPVAKPEHVTKPDHAAKPEPVAMPEPIQVAPAKKAICSNCGVVVSVKAVEVEGKGSALGVIAGGVAGGLVGNQVGQGTGRDLATIAGVVGGAIAGNKIEQKMKKSTVYDVAVKLENGEERVLRHNTDPGFAAGDKVWIENDLVVKHPAATK